MFKEILDLNFDGKGKTTVNYYDDKAKFVADLQLLTERYGLDSNSIFHLDHSVSIKLEKPGIDWSASGRLVPLIGRPVRLCDIEAGDVFKFNETSVTRTAEQVGKTEILCPPYGKPYSKHEVYGRSEREVILFTEK